MSTIWFCHGPLWYPFEQIQLAYTGENQFLCLGPGLYSMNDTLRKFALKVDRDLEIDTHILEKEMATHSSILAWEISMDRGAWQVTVPGVIRVRQNLATKPPLPPHSSIHFKNMVIKISNLDHQSNLYWQYKTLHPRYIIKYLLKPAM